MKTVRHLIYGEVLRTVVLVLLAFLGLFAFFDLIDELRLLGRPSLLRTDHRYGWSDAFAVVVLSLPSRCYELMPIASLIGTIYALARLAQHSEFTILRVSGMGPWQALRLTLSLGLIFTFVTFVIGDYIAPISTRHAQVLKAEYRGAFSSGQTGAWLREREGDRISAVNVQAVEPDGTLRGVKIYVFDTTGHIRETLRATHGFIDEANSVWQLENVERTRIDGTIAIQQNTHSQWSVTSRITLGMLHTALLKPERMRTIELWTYVRHLQANNQSAQRHEIEFWRKVFYPLSCIVMTTLALPFAYIHFRERGLSAYIFLGILIGVSFVLINAIFSHIGNLQGWTPWLTAAIPATLYWIASLCVFGWRVLRH